MNIAASAASRGPSRAHRCWSRCSLALRQMRSRCMRACTASGSPHPKRQWSSRSRKSAGGSVALLWYTSSSRRMKLAKASDTLRCRDCSGSSRRMPRTCRVSGPGPDGGAACTDVAADVAPATATGLSAWLGGVVCSSARSVSSTSGSVSRKRFFLTQRPMYSALTAPATSAGQPAAASASLSAGMSTNGVLPPSNASSHSSSMLMASLPVSTTSSVRPTAKPSVSSL
mmetsp:Transcript_27223/g.63596  ORF Transcript_27223/g.63596 Transcript_27223/m.63596 type:complete len:228 (-) Transcript_27223:1221-1904(-)